MVDKTSQLKVKTSPQLKNTFETIDGVIAAIQGIIEVSRESLLAAFQPPFVSREEAPNYRFALEHSMLEHDTHHFEITALRKIDGKERKRLEFKVSKKDNAPAEFKNLGIADGLDPSHSHGNQW